MSELAQFIVPLFKKSLGSLDGILEKAQAFVQEKGGDESVLLNAALIADMFPLKKQVQIACDNAKGAVGRLAGVEIPAFADEETTMVELRARIAKTIEWIVSVPEASFTDAATRHIVMPYFPGKYIVGSEYAREHAVPNFLFHVVTAYAILRKEGVPLGKADYIGGLPLHDIVA